MKDHRDTCRTYAKAYQAKLTTKKCPLDVEDQITKCERKLDIFNLVIIRQQIEMEVYLHCVTKTYLTLEFSLYINFIFFFA